uniref:Putative nucleotide-sugar transporter n=1 Tax=Xenopsylla cheopis TaxID=163159 RepID=A0A6M2DX28_XENCH
MFAVFILKKKLRSIQWSALVVLVIGVVLVQLVKSDAPSTLQTNLKQNHLIGFSAALAACFLSGFAGIYFEKILKGSDISIWMRNIQLSLLSLPFGFITSFLSDHKIIFDKGFFYGYDFFIWYLILLQACGGLIVAMVVKYADNILKGFATSLAIIISCIVSIYIFNFHLTLQFTIGAVFVICSIFMYSYIPKSDNVHSSSKV